MTKQSISVIGTGRMGNAFAVNLLKAGHEVFVYDVNPDAYANLVEKGAVAVANVQEKVNATPFVVLSLPRSDIVEDTVAGKGGILAKLAPGSVVIDMSTTSPEITRRLAERVAEAGSDFLDAPVSGHLTGAVNATLTVMAGGRREAFQKAREPIFEVLGKNIFYAGPSGAGQSLKLINNLLYNINRLALCEGLVMGKKAGVDLEVMSQAVSFSTGASYANTHLPRDILNRNFEGRESNLTLACKTLKLITDYADALGTPLLLGNVAKQVYDFMKLSGNGHKTPSCVVQFYESGAGVEANAESSAKA